PRWYFGNVAPRQCRLRAWFGSVPKSPPARLSASGPLTRPRRFAQPGLQCSCTPGIIRKCGPQCRTPSADGVFAQRVAPLLLGNPPVFWHKPRTLLGDLVFEVAHLAGVYLALIGSVALGRCACWQGKCKLYKAPGSAGS